MEAFAVLQPEVNRPAYVLLHARDDHKILIFIALTEPAPFQKANIKTMTNLDKLYEHNIFYKV